MNKNSFEENVYKYGSIVLLVIIAIVFLGSSALSFTAQYQEAKNVWPMVIADTFPVAVLFPATVDLSLMGYVLFSLAGSMINSWGVKWFGRGALVLSTLLSIWFNYQHSIEYPLMAIVPPVFLFLITEGFALLVHHWFKLKSTTITLDELKQQELELAERLQAIETTVSERQQVIDNLLDDEQLLKVVYLRGQGKTLEQISEVSGLTVGQVKNSWYQKLNGQRAKLEALG